MKKYKILSYTLALVLGALLFTNCSDSDGDKRVVNISVYKDQLASGTGGKKTIRFKDNETRQLNIHIMPTDAVNKGVSYRMKKSSVATVSPEGLLTGVAIGLDTLIIEALDGSGIFVEYDVDVVDHKIKITSIVLPTTAQKATIGEGEVFELAPLLEIKPADAWNKSMTYTSSDESILKVDENGSVTGIALGTATITIEAKDGSGKSAVSVITVASSVPKYYSATDMKNWTAVASHALPSEGGKNKAGAIIDGDLTEAVAFLSMVKPGGTMDDNGNVISVGASEDVYVVVDMKKEHEVDFFRYHHRHTNKILRFFGVTISGSSDGVAFTKIAENVEIPKAQDGGADTKDSGQIDIPSSKYRYYKVSFTDFDYGSINVPGQINEIQFGRMANE